MTAAAEPSSTRPTLHPGATTYHAEYCHSSRPRVR